MEKDKEQKPFYMNFAVVSVAASVLLVILIYWAFNLQTAAFFVVEAHLSIFFLEAINYLEHYGLRRKKLSNGEY